MEERFKKMAEEKCNELDNKTPLMIDGDFKEHLAQFYWDWFIADMSDDYFHRTLPEHDALEKKMKAYIKDKTGLDDDLTKKVYQLL
jgi:hypothetical protein